MEKLYNFFYYEVEEAPMTFGVFHLCSLAILAVAIFCLLRFYKADSDREFRKLMLVFWLIMVAGELYRQPSFSLEFEDGKAVWDYAWYQFPFQLCSSPLYALPFVFLLPEGKLRDGFCAFLATFAFFGGAAVMVYPGNVMTKVIGVSIQSMVHHSVQVLIALAIVKRYRDRLDHKFINRGMAVFFVFLAVAMTLNIVVYLIFSANGIDDDFNMFYISPFYEGSLPVLSTIQEKTTGWLMPPLYSILFVGASYGIFRLEKLLAERK